MPRRKPKAPPVTRGKLKVSGRTRVSTNADKPLFSLEYLTTGKYSLSSCEQVEKAALIETLVRLSNLTWGEIGQAPRHGNGHEIILSTQIREPIPAYITDEVRILAFRFYRKAPMVGYRKDRVFYILWLDRSFELYNHG